jgi:hypothetical protein
MYRKMQNGTFPDLRCGWRPLTLRHETVQHITTPYPNSPRHLRLTLVPPFTRNRVDAARRSGVSARAAGGQAKRLLLCCALLVALLWQSVLPQAHHHRSFGLASPAALVAKGNVGRGDPAPDTPAMCPICLEVANAGPAMLPAAIHLETPAPTVAFTARAQQIPVQRTSQSHVWRSRAPPHSQA